MPEVDAIAAGGFVAHAPRVGHRRTADRVFLASLSYTAALTAVWLFFLITQRDGGPFFRGYNPGLETVGRIFFGFFFFSILWGLIWYGVRRALLRRFVGFSPEELRLTFASRMDEPFDLRAFLARHSERRIRIVDMIGRRGRFFTIGLGFWAAVYAHISAEPSPNFLTAVVQDNLIDAVILSWVALALYYSNGFLARMFYGAQSRLMDGSLARANCLLITTLWSTFKFVMVPIGMQLAARFPPRTFSTLFVLIWGSYLVADGFSEIVGSLFGKQKLRVWGLGEVNRKSLAGTWAGFLASLGLCLWVVLAHHLSPAWVGLAVVISVSNTFMELFSPRGTDDFTMATGNALICWAFGVLVY